MTGGAEAVRTGRLVAVRLGPGEDLVLGIERVAAEHGVARAMVRGGPGSLERASLRLGPEEAERAVRVDGPAVELLAFGGEVRPDPATGSPRADLSGSVGDPRGRVSAGRFAPGENPVCVTVELVLEELLPEDGGARPGRPCPRPAG